MHISNGIHINSLWDLIVILAVVAVIVLIVGVGYVNHQNSKPFQLSITSSLSREDAIETMQERMARDGWVLGFRDSGTLIMTADRSARFRTTASIGPSGLMAGFLHASAARRSTTVEIDVSKTAGGSIIVANGSQRGDGIEQYIDTLLQSLPRKE